MLLPRIGIKVGLCSSSWTERYQGKRYIFKECQGSKVLGRREGEAEMRSAPQRGSFLPSSAWHCSLLLGAHTGCTR